MSSPTLAELLAAPSVENWREIVEIGKHKLKMARVFEDNDDTRAWEVYLSTVKEAIAKWPPEIERLCPASWPKEFREVVEHRVRETDTYGYYLAKICGHPDLKLSDGSQAVWLERRFTGGIVPVSTVQSAMRSLNAAKAAIGAAFDAPSVGAAWGHIKRGLASINNAVNILSNGVRNIGKVGCADLTGGLIIEKYRSFCATTGNPRCECIRGFCLEQKLKHEYRLEVEVKVGKEEQRPEQIARMNSVRARGGCYVLARSVEEAVAEIKRFRDSR